MAWMRDMGFFEARVDELKDPSMQYAAQPQVSLLGRVLDVDGSILKLGGTKALFGVLH
jgi:hypothetical protein